MMLNTVPPALRVAPNSAIPTDTIPVMDYADFMQANSSLPNDERYHCVAYFACREDDQLRLICCMADDTDGDILVSSSICGTNDELPSFAAVHPSFQRFEREIHESFGLRYLDHPWLKPLRFTGINSEMPMSDYPFFRVTGDSLHEVGVGPVHAGIIEPGYFRFTCDGERILHLEIQLGFQHRGLEQLMLAETNLNRRIRLAENIAGDTTAGHAATFATAWETLCNYETPEPLLWLRTMALEIERLAVHTGNLSAICGDIAYQLGCAVFGRLRTPIINFLQTWTGSRFARTLIRPAALWYPFTDGLAAQLSHILDAFERDFVQMGEFLFNMPSALSRFENTGTVGHDLAQRAGFAGMAARASGLPRDIRFSHPVKGAPALQHQPMFESTGDVLARTRLRYEEALQSIGYLRWLIRYRPQYEAFEHRLPTPSPNRLVIALNEGWRGQICHCMMTDSTGNLKTCKFYDTSFYNWFALALAVRRNQISDFPICNKSFDLSYCGVDL